MKNIIIKDKNNIIISSPNTKEENEVNEFIDFNISINAWGKSERWILKDSESYEESDVL
jgi:hypothetical protein